MQKRDIESMVNQLCRTGNDLGMQLGRNPQIEGCRSASEVEDYMRQYPSLRLLIVIMPSKSSEDYSFVSGIPSFDSLLIL